MLLPRPIQGGRPRPARPDDPDLAVVGLRRPAPFQGDAGNGLGRRLEAAVEDTTYAAAAAAANRVFGVNAAIPHPQGKLRH